MTDPLDAWLDWYRETAPDLRRELGLALVRMWPQLRSPLELADPSEGLDDRIQRLTSGPLERVGAAAMLAGLTDLVIAERTDPTSWAQTDDLLEALGEASELPPLQDDELTGLIEHFTERARARAPLRMRQWSRLGARWRVLRTGALAADSLDRARRQAMLPPEVS